MMVRIGNGHMNLQRILPDDELIYLAHNHPEKLNEKPVKPAPTISIYTTMNTNMYTISLQTEKHILVI